MTIQIMRITRLTTEHVRVPLARSCRVPLSTPQPAAPKEIDLVIVHLETDVGHSGLGFTYVSGPGAGAIRSLIDTELAQIILGEDPRETDRLLAKVESHFRSVGFSGLAARA